MPVGATQTNKTFPQTRAHDMTPSDDAAGFIRSSQSVGVGHEPSDNRLPDPNKDWATTETGEGRNGS